MDGSFLQHVIENSPEYYGGVILLALIPVLIKAANSVINFYEDVRVKRVLNRIKFLSENSPNDSELANYLESMKRHEIYRVATGIETYPDKAKMLMRIFDLGIANNKELKGIYHYLTPLESKVKVSINNMDRIRIIYSFCSGLIFMFTGLCIAIYFQFSGPIEALAGSLIMFLCIFFGVLLFRDFNGFRTLTRVAAALDKLGEYAENDSDIELFRFRSNKRSESRV
ncbi:hypothetical protein [Pseudoalteromonas obscura]|uniref:Uncharacterized protein n=1 Tax=Pseudoalteromonas obscura TaxID=3048491 RepID=A0ABT7EK41_9GAMM|nr:hypothetical protein [Pseudoalteromonas sp. P94(2023)]MDK2595417.1 hypothetical protein [Pseudoalteromonas sp. P94(2023)]